MPVLGISTSPRRTLVWAPDATVATRLRELLAAAGCESHPAELGGLPSDLVTDVDIGVVAFECLETLQAAGYSFEWAAQQPGLRYRVSFGRVRHTAASDAPFYSSTARPLNRAGLSVLGA